MPAHEELRRFLDLHGESDGLFYLGHASVLCVFNGKRILFDPVVLSKPYGDSWAFFPPQVLDAVLFDVDAVVVSHIHQDHYDLRFIQALGGKAKLVVIGGRPSLLKDLEENKVQNLQVIEPEVLTEIFPGVQIFGVTHESNGIDASAIVFSKHFCVYHGNDNYLQPASLRKFTAVGRTIDVACIPYAYVHWYPFLMDSEPGQAAATQVEGDRLVKMYMDDCIDSIRTLRPKAMIPFGANLLLNHGGAYSAINLSVKTPIEFCEYAQEHAPDVAGVVKPMLAGDHCGYDDGGLRVHIKSAFDGDTYRRRAAEFLAALPEPVQAPRRLADLKQFLATLNERLGSITQKEDHIVRVDLQLHGDSLKLEIDCSERRAVWVDVFTEGVAYHHFKLDPISSAAFINGCRLEEVIGMRRFTLKRVPNVYSKAILRLVGTVM